MTVILGDDIIQDEVTPYVRKFQEQDSGARILLKLVSELNRFGCPELDGDRSVRIEEKPTQPKSSYAVTNICMYDRRVVDFCKRLKLSHCNELEIADINNAYINEGALYSNLFDGWQPETGQFEPRFRAGYLVPQQRFDSSRYASPSESIYAES